MNSKEREHFDDIILKAVQSGKQETSGLVTSIFERLEPAVERSIEKHVNGKIRDLTTKMDEYIISDEEWKTKAEPVIKMGKNLQGFGKVSGLIFAIIMGLSAVIGVFYGLITWLKK